MTDTLPHRPPFSDPAGLTLEDLRGAAFLKEAMAPSSLPLYGRASAGIRGDVDEEPSYRCGKGLKDLTAAAVLVPIVPRRAGETAGGIDLTVLLTRRGEDLADHAGQISFPGGRMEPGEEAIEAALRETHEELGILHDAIEVLGHLDAYVTGTGFVISPVVALVHPPFTLVPDVREVAEAFEVPLSHLLDPARHERHSRMKEGVERHYHAIGYHDRFIWGATAGMLINLYEVLTAP